MASGPSSGCSDIRDRICDPFEVKIELGNNDSRPEITVAAGSRYAFALQILRKLAKFFSIFRN
jgi:hypothetical protein